ncbi:hypothetical protein SAMN05421736_11537 [Evansella caseinilytica]|uniref:Uncharacterized protein n=1 Tax=Evansella caseinilytica TaxID=1503961 RepID=A0A1H3TK35_9BACI|nr:hypothetical protein [Evansella caseinilytica]SDZ50643.1 hypothetical protein SAMN05421736_11537 [Evansella caseinilytica]
MNKKEEQLVRQLQVVIKKLEEDYSNEITYGGIIKDIYIRYKSAESILDNEGETKSIFIEGSTRDYLDSFSDYNNPLLSEMWKAEKLLSELRKENSND